jgi:hypothetical protein
VELKTTSGGTVLVGLVERIDVMRTLVRSDKGVPIAVPNSSITGMIVSNESRIGKSQYAANFKVRFAHAPHPCQTAPQDRDELHKRVQRVAHWQDPVRGQVQGGVY